MYYSPLLLPILNILLHIMIMYLIKYSHIYMEGNVYGFLFLFVFIPWLVFVLISGILYAKSMQKPSNYKKTNML